MFNTFRTASFALVATLAIGGAAQAQDAQTTSKMVKYGDLDLHTDAGAATLRHRVAIAARSVCGPAEMIGSPDFASYQSCLSQATAQAAQRADTMIAAVRTGTRYATITHPAA